MSDYSTIPGVGTNKYGTDKLIEGLMKLERVPRDKAQERVDAWRRQKTVWSDVARDVGNLREGARSLFSSRNPFNERVAKSSDEEVLTATATRVASEQTREILVKQAAAPDRFLSADQAKDYRVPAGSYAWKTGEATVELRYPGGTLQDFADAINRKGRDLLRASVVAVTEEKRALVLESLKPGLGNRLAFASPDAERMALDAGMIERVNSRAREFEAAKPQAWERPLDAALVRAEAGALAVSTGGEGKLPLGSPVKTAGLVLELRYRIIDLPEEPTATPPAGPVIGPTGTVTWGGVTVEGAASDPGLPPWSPPETPPRVDDLTMVSALGPGGTVAALPALEDTGEPATLRVELGGLLPELSALAFRNRDTGRKLEILSARVFDPAETGGVKPKRSISTARDAIVVLDGVEATRGTNLVDDLIPGVSISVKDASAKPVKLKIEPDRAAVKEAIIGLVGGYNRLMAGINILSRSDAALVSEITYYTAEEKKTAQERLGILQGDSTLSLLRSSLIRTMTEPYATSEGNGLAILSQLGIASDSRKPGGSAGLDVTRMRGYLEIDEAALDAALATKFEAARQIFGNDTDGDLLMDSGAAVRLDALLKPYVETAGLLSLKAGTLDRQITAERRTIESLDVQLARKEQELKTKYGIMEGALSRMEGTSASIDQFSQNNTGQ